MGLAPRLVVCCAICLVAIAGCAQGQTQGTDPADPGDRDPSKRLKKLENNPEAGADAPFFTYSAVGQRNPFRPYFQTDTPPPRDAKTELERYELDQLKLIAVVSMVPPKAMVEDPTGKGHVVKVGMRMGRHGGLVTHIRSRELIVRQEIPTPNLPLRHLVHMRLPEEPPLRLN